ncbi:type IV pilus assembly protein FimV [Ramlibacter albus]|uniref:Uncharacterized protein n=1 Tax=Ramlibacter albus TaxID=2079448 RepID=A0A923MAG8_9BURK|nr:hypothetical protein [Ramlibacter albus]MBC5765744.1 hypothetical protein [Ramlibacter albus]
MRSSRISRGVPALLAVFAVAFLLPAAAVTLGAARGDVAIGRPIDIAVPLVLDSGEAEPCLKADVMQGGTRMGGIALRIETGPAGAAARIVSAGVLEEPTLTFDLHVGCGRKVTRRYVMLATFPAQGQVASKDASPAPAAENRAAMPARVPAPLPAAAPAAAVPQATRATAPPSVPAPTHRKAAAAAAAPSRMAGEAQAPPSDAVLSLRTTPLLLTPEDGGQRRADAAGLWRTLQAPPDELARKVDRLETMEREVQSLRTLVQQNRAALAAMRPSQGESAAGREWITVLLAAAAVLLALGSAAWWWRSRAAPAPASRWWVRDPGAHSRTGGDGDFVVETSQPPLRVTRPALVAQASEPAGAQAPPTATATATATAFATRPTTPPRAAAEPPQSNTPDSRPLPGPVEFMPSQAASLRSVKAAELADIEQQAQFFLAIGHAAQAANVLEAHVHDHADTSPVVWLDLLEIYHSLGQREDYERIRAMFAAQFGGNVPDFEGYRTQSGGLLDYRRALTRIVALWPSPRVLEVIEESIFSRPDNGSEAFDLEAYRDLLMLYNVGKLLMQDGEGAASQVESHASGWGSTDLQPLSALVNEAHSVSPLDRPPRASMLTTAAEGDGPDIDLDSLLPADDFDSVRVGKA